MGYFNQIYLLFKELLEQQYLHRQNVKFGSTIRGDFGEIYAAKKLEDLGFKSEEIFSEEPHPEGKNKIDYTIKKHNEEIYIEVKTGQMSWVPKFTERQLRYSDFFVILYTPDERFDFVYEFVYTKEEMREILQRGERKGDTKAYYLYFYENKDIERYEKRMKKNGIFPTNIEKATILNPDGFNKKWEKILSK